MILIVSVARAELDTLLWEWVYAGHRRFSASATETRALWRDGFKGSARAAVDTVADRIGLLQAQVAHIGGCLQRRGLDHGVRVRMTVASEGLRSVRDNASGLRVWPLIA